MATILKLNDDKCNFQKCMDKSHPCSKKNKRCIDYLNMSNYIMKSSTSDSQKSVSEHIISSKITPSSQPDIKIIQPSKTTGHELAPSLP